MFQRFHVIFAQLSLILLLFMLPCLNIFFFFVNFVFYIRQIFLRNLKVTLDNIQPYILTWFSSESSEHTFKKCIQVLFIFLLIMIKKETWAYTWSLKWHASLKWVTSTDLKIMHCTWNNILSRVVKKNKKRSHTVLVFATYAGCHRRRH